MVKYNNKSINERKKDELEYHEAVNEFYEHFDKVKEDKLETKSGLDLNQDINYYYEWSTD